MIHVQTIADTTSPQGCRITTLQACYPRFIHAQVMTHSLIRRNARSSRAMPIKFLIQDVLDNPVNPINWGKNQSGMQAGEELPSYLIAAGQEIWNAARKDAVKHAAALAKIGVHKQIVNRILEPFAHIHVVMTATHSYEVPGVGLINPWEDFVRQRLHDDAQPEIQELARQVKACLTKSKPNIDIIHLPYISDTTAHEYPESARVISAARCARVSYKPFDSENSDVQKDLNLAERLLKSKHMSPFEHPATASDGQTGPYYGWRSLRHQNP
jgi:hypothetical protein